MSKQNNEQKCTFKGCGATGIPRESFDFYACDECCEELERLIKQKYAEAYARHNNN